MGLFGKSKKDKKIEKLTESNNRKSREIKRLKKLSDEKDAWMSSIASDALRKGSSLGGQVLADKKKYLKNKSK